MSKVSLCEHGIIMGSINPCNLCEIEKGEWELAILKHVETPYANRPGEGYDDNSPEVLKLKAKMQKLKEKEEI